MQHEIELAVRVVALPLLGGLAVVSMVRDTAARARVRDDENAATHAVAWDRLAPELRAVAEAWTRDA
ncbi:MAG TPA: hypothetical protein VFL59_11765 [Candidatus Nanopelagicales bacterium]|nr:hypothetical protein [Candidatus Nanopelagicales bacterium]